MSVSGRVGTVGYMGECVRGRVGTVGYMGECVKGKSPDLEGSL